MATGRTLSKFERVYADGYDLSGYSRSIGPLTAEFDAVELTAPMSDAVRGYLPGSLLVTAGTFNGVFQSTTDAGVEISTLQTPSTPRTLMVPIGVLAAPTFADPVFVAKNSHAAFDVHEDGGAITVSAQFSAYDAATSMSYSTPWGILVSPKAARTAVNSSTGVDSYGAATSLGGYMAYQIFAGDIVGTLKLQHADTNIDGSFADLGGCTTTITIPSGGIAETTTKTTLVNRYLRWQITITSGTTVTFALAFVRGR